MAVLCALHNGSSGSRYTNGLFPKIMDTFFGGGGCLFNTDHDMLVSILGSPYLGKVPKNYIGPQSL